MISSIPRAGEAFERRNPANGDVVAARPKAGTVFVNCYHSAGIPQMPFGGYKESGIGRELGQEGMDLFMETRSVSIKLT